MDLVQRGDKMRLEKYCVSFAKVALDKEEGVELLGVYFGGLTYSEEDAELVATECVNSVKGCTVLPTIMPVIEAECLLDLLDDATARFQSKIAQMQEAYHIIHRPAKKKSK